MLLDLCKKTERIKVHVYMCSGRDARRLSWDVSWDTTNEVTFQRAWRTSRPSTEECIWNALFNEIVHETRNYQ
jgi:hypothetical protein